MSRLFINLGGLGDICAFLPALMQENKPKLMVLDKHAEVLEGCSYVESVPFVGTYGEHNRAVKEAREITSDVRSCHPMPGSQNGHVITSFVNEMWRHAGVYDRWNDQPPLVFDQRDKGREAALRTQVFGKHRKPPILVAVGGNTAPFKYRELLLALVNAHFKGERKVIDISDLRAERFYDLLGLYDHAHCLIASDSAPLHLAQACPTLPVIALTNDSPSYAHGSPWRANHVFYCRYSDWPFRSVEMLNAIGRAFASRPQPLVHVWNNYQAVDWNVFKPLPDALPVPIVPGMFGRDSHTGIKDSARFPFLKDMLRAAAWCCKDDGLIVLSRPDIECERGVLSENFVSDFISSHKPYWAHRSIKDDAGNLTYHPAADLFAFSKKFYMEHRRELPDLICGTDQWWSKVMVQWLKRHGGVEIPFAITRKEGKKTTVISARTAHNEKLAQQWFTANNINTSLPKVTDQIPGQTINRRALSPFGYNGSLIEWQGKYLLAYRWHKNGKQTVLAVAELDDKYNVTRNRGVLLNEKSAEDPRLFIYQDSLWISYVASDWPANPPHCVTKYGRLVATPKDWEIHDLHQPIHGKNDWTALVKNLVFFECAEKLFAIFQGSPQQSVIELDASHVRDVHHSDMPHWAWGHVRGGCIAPQLYRGKLLRFFHSRLDNETPLPWYHRYYIGVALMEPEPPFKTIALSSEPIIRASEEDELTSRERASCPHYKPKVAFPMGVVARDGGWHLSIGVNDSAVAVLRIEEQHLKL